MRMLFSIFPGLLMAAACFTAQAEEKTVELILAPAEKPAGRIVLWKSNLPKTGYATGESRGTVGFYGGENRLWIYFDLQAIPADAFIVSAALRLWQYEKQGQPHTHVFALCRVLKHVDPDFCCWDNPVQGITWTKPGANQTTGETADRSPPVASTVITKHPFVWRQWDVTEALQTMVRENSNHGFVLLDRDVKMDDPQRTSVMFSMPEAENAEHRPRLVVRYSDTPVERTANNSVLLPPPAEIVIRTRQAYRDGETPLPAYRMTKMAAITSGAPWSNFSATLDRGRVSAGTAKQPETRLLLRFGQLLAIPSPATQVRVILHVRPGEANQSLQLRRLTTDWQIAEVSWNERRWGQLWNTPGGDAEAIRMPCQISTDGPMQVLAFDVSDWFADWQKHPERNYGVMFQAPSNSASGSVQIASDRDSITQYRPQLEIFCGLNPQ